MMETRRPSRAILRQTMSRREKRRRTARFVAECLRLDAMGHDAAYIARAMGFSEELVRVALESNQHLRARDAS